MDKLAKRALQLMKLGYFCDFCLGRVLAGQLLTNFNNKERGKAIRTYLALLIDSGQNFDVDMSNFHDFKFRNAKVSASKGKCFICQNFFDEKLEEVATKIKKRIEKEGIEFSTFWIGTKLSDEMARNEEKVFEEIGVEYAESLKSDINREVGKLVEKLTGKKAVEQNPDLRFTIDFKNNKIEMQIKSIYVLGMYKKLKRGFPQAKWLCVHCQGKGCVVCKGKGKLYSTSIQEIIEKPFLKYAKAKKAKLSAAGREDIDARCLDWRPFVIEIVKPKIRSLDLKKIEKEINKRKSLQVKLLGFTDKQKARVIKAYKADKTYEALVVFKQAVDKAKLKDLEKFFKNKLINQATPLRVLHRRKDKVRKRRVKEVKAKLLGKNKVLFRIRAEGGLYIKELINGDYGRTKPSFAEFLGNEVKSIKLDVVKIHFPKNLLKP